MPVRRGRGSAVLSDKAHESSPVDVVDTDGGSNSVASFGPALSPRQPLADSARRIRGPSPLSGDSCETDTGSNATRNDKQRRVINGTDSSGVQIIEGERHQVELEAEPQPRRFACSVGDCRRRYRNIDRLSTSLHPLRYCYLILSSCSSSLSAFGRPWRNWTRITRVGAAQLVAAFRVNRGDSPVDCCT